MRKKLAFGMLLVALMAAPTMTSMAGEWINVDGSYWYKNDDGSAYTGWLSENGKWYFLDRETCYMRTGWVQDNGKWYYCYDDGSMHPGGWLEMGKKLYYMYEDGSMATGVFQLGYYRYQADEDGSIIRNKLLNGIKYDAQGCMMVKDEDHDWVYLAPNDDIQYNAVEKLKERYLEHEYSSQYEFEKAVRSAFTGIWSEDEIRSFINEMEEEFFDSYDCEYNYYRES